MEPILCLIVCLDCVVTFLELVLILLDHVKIGDILRLWIQVASADCVVHLGVRGLAYRDLILFFFLILFFIARLTVVGR